MRFATLSAGLLALACLSCAFAIGKARSRHAEGDQPALFCALLGLLLPAAAAAVGVLGVGSEADWQAAHLWLSQASRDLGLPLLGAAALALGRGWVWSRPSWGRIVLGLCAFFELFRQLDLLEPYRLGLGLVTLLLIAYAGAVQWPRRAPLLAALGAAGLLALAGLAIGSSGMIGPLRPLELCQVLLAAAYPLLAGLLLSLPGAAQGDEPSEKPAKAL